MLRVLLFYTLNFPNHMNPTPQWESYIIKLREVLYVSVRSLILKQDSLVSSKATPILLTIFDMFAAH